MLRSGITLALVILNLSINAMTIAPRIDAFTPEIAAETAALRARVARVIPDVEWPAFAPDIAAINRLKRDQTPVPAAAPAAPPATPEDISLLREIRDSLKKSG